MTMDKEALIAKIIKERILDDDEDAEYIRTLPPEAAFLIYNDVAFIGCDHQHDWPRDGTNPCIGKPHGKLLSILLSDTFGYACADGEDVKPEQCAEVAEIYRKFGYTGLVCWAAKQRGEPPVIEYTEDAEYQKVWKELYGDLELPNKNRCNIHDPRWSSEKINLKPWDTSRVRE
jgi:hypothetical protein